MRNPLTILVTEANSAMPPSRRISGGKSGPAMRIAPTTAIAEIAFVRDISGVCNSRDTRRITPSPMKVDNRKTNTMGQ